MKMHGLHWLAAALTAAILALVSQAALAHGGHHHELAAASPVAPTELARQDPGTAALEATASHSVTAAWSQSCPDGSGGDCCCKHQPVSIGAGKIAIVNLSSRTWPVSLVAAAPAIPAVETPPQQFTVSRVHPRAPPSRFS